MLRLMTIFEPLGSLFVGEMCTELVNDREFNVHNSRR